MAQGACYTYGDLGKVRQGSILTYTWYEGLSHQWPGSALKGGAETKAESQGEVTGGMTGEYPHSGSGYLPSD